MMNNDLKVSEVKPSPFHVNFPQLMEFFGGLQKIHVCLRMYHLFWWQTSAIITLDASKSNILALEVLRDILIGGARHQAAQASACTWVFPKIEDFTPKMDGENNGKPYFLMDDLGGCNPLFLETSI